MKNRIAVNSKFFTGSQAKGEAAHVYRLIANDKNVLDVKLTVRNFGTKIDVYNENYLNALAAMPTTTKNILIDSVLVLPVEQMRQLINECKEDKEGKRNWKQEINKSINKMAKEMEREMGFTFVGYRMHLDEGEKLNGSAIKLNSHAHLHFANVCMKDITLEKLKNVTQKDENGKAMRDPKRKGKWLYERDESGKVKQELVKIPLLGRSPLSLHQSRGSNSIWSKQQDIAAKHLKHLGFERGISAEITNAKHLSKQQHVARALKEKEQRIESLALAEVAAMKRINVLKNEYEKVLDQFIKGREKMFSFLLSDNVDLDVVLKEEKKVESLFYKIYDEEVREAVKKSTIERFDDIKPLDAAFVFDERFEAVAEKIKQYDVKKKERVKFKME